MHLGNWILGVAAALGLAACDSGTSSVDLAVPDMVRVPIQCVTAQDCPAATPLCLYAVDEGCTAKGECWPARADPGVTLEMCGCNGQLVQTTTQYYAGGGGFAFGPVIAPDTYPTCVPDGGTW